MPATAFQRSHRVAFYERLSFKPRWVFEELIGADAIGQYLRDKMQAIRRVSQTQIGSRVHAELGRTAAGRESPSLRHVHPPGAGSRSYGRVPDMSS